MLLLAQELAESHGTFFAAAMLADLGVPITAAIRALTSRRAHALLGPSAARTCGVAAIGKAEQLDQEAITVSFQFCR